MRRAGAGRSSTAGRRDRAAAADERGTGHMRRAGRRPVVADGPASRPAGRDARAAAGRRRRGHGDQRRAMSAERGHAPCRPQTVVDGGRRGQRRAGYERRARASTQPAAGRSATGARRASAPAGIRGRDRTGQRAAVRGGSPSRSRCACGRTRSGDRRSSGSARWTRCASRGWSRTGGGRTRRCAAGIGRW